MSREPDAAHALLLEVRRHLTEAACPARAAGAQAYMKSAMPFHGVAMPRFRRICRAVYRQCAFATLDDWRDAVLTLWRDAQYREERYAAIELSGIPLASRWQTPAVLAMYEEMIVTGAWWDYVDWIASNRVGTMLPHFPGMRRTLRSWARSDDRWKRRTAIIAQLRRGQDTDIDLLFACIEPSLRSPDFFLRKGIGWALRQLARTHPDEVRRYVAANRDRLSALSIREAVKHLGPEKPRSSCQRAT